MAYAQDGAPVIPAPLFNHRATVWRHREKRVPGLREVTRQWGRVAGAQRIGLVLSVNRERREDTGGGERTTGEYAAVCNRRADVKEGDVLEVYRGPMAPVNLRVDERDATSERTAELLAVPYIGKLAS